MESAVNPLGWAATGPAVRANRAKAERSRTGVTEVASGTAGRTSMVTVPMIGFRSRVCNRQEAFRQFRLVHLSPRGSVPPFRFNSLRLMWLGWPSISSHEGHRCDDQEK